MNGPGTRKGTTDATRGGEEIDRFWTSGIGRSWKTKSPFGEDGERLVGPIPKHVGSQGGDETSMTSENPHGREKPEKETRGQWFRSS